MTTLTINDLHVTTDLDSASMSAVRGGYHSGSLYLPLSGLNASKHDFTFDAEQLTSQTQQNFNANGNNVAFASDIGSTFKPVQKNTSSISF